MTDLKQRVDEGERALKFLEMQGYRRCDIEACNCPYWHGGNASTRLMEIHDLLSEADCRPHQKTAYVALEELIKERDALTAENEQQKALIEQRARWHDQLIKEAGERMAELHEAREQLTIVRQENEALRKERDAVRAVVECCMPIRLTPNNARD